MNLGELSYINIKKLHDAIVRLLEQFALITMNILHVFLGRQMFQRYIFARFSKIRHLNSPLLYNNCSL